MIVAGESSGDRLAAELVEGVRAQRADVRFHGVTGPRMRAAGVETWEDIETLAVRGLVEVLPALPAIWRLKRQVLANVRELRPALYIGVDAPEFNLRIERLLKARGIRTLHYVCPTFWAWRPGRVRTFRDAVDHMLCIFPFEPEALARHGVPATFVGHPLTKTRWSEAKPARLKRQLLPEAASLQAPLVALLPGSRLAEVEAHAALFVETMKLIAQALPESHFAVPLVTRATRERFERELWHRAETLVPRTRLMFGHADYALRAADVALVASGTATLEACLLDCPQVVTYRLNPVTAWLVRRQLTTRWVAQPNIIAGEGIVPERLQRDATPKRLAEDILGYLRDAARREAVRAHYARVRAALQIDEAKPGERLVATVLKTLPPS
ncbi:MAG: lipid-A-disaccharide synthase [Casimicrobiaceae bacterium]|nr:lipid-A-disaccharide synthase [Casimicrobiaceae bacterium]MDW8312465.1 lipid-A-disaccharide synthase [Burkholderiales bacterium]